MAFAVFNDDPLSQATQVPENDYFTGDGTTKTFTLVKKPFTSVGNNVYVGGPILHRHTGAVTGTGYSITLVTAPAVGAKVIVPSSKYVLMKAYDQDPIPGVTNPRIYEAAVHFGDISDIAFWQYEKTAPNSGIKVQIVDKDTSAGAIASLIQIAPALADGTAGTYQAAGTPYYFDKDFVGLTEVDASQAALTQALTVADGTEIPEGCWIIINPGQPTEDTVWVTNVTGDDLDLREFLTHDHDPGELVLVCGGTVWLKFTCPLDYTGGIPTNLWDLAIDCAFDAVSR